MDLPPVGGTFTWLNNRDSPFLSRIDKFPVSPVWEAQFPGVSHIRFPRLCSDHFSILLDCGDFIKGSKSFKFENIWLKSEGFVETVK
jgi:hypothetical protein